MDIERTAAKNLLSGEDANPQDVDFNFGSSGEDKFLRDMFNQHVPLYASGASYDAALGVFERDVMEKLPRDKHALFLQNLRDERAGLTARDERAERARGRLDMLIQKYSK